MHPFLPVTLILPWFHQSFISRPSNTSKLPTMSAMAVLSNAFYLLSPKLVPTLFPRRQPIKKPLSLSVSSNNARHWSTFLYSRHPTFRIKSFQHEDGEKFRSAEPKYELEKVDGTADEVPENQNSETTGTGASFLTKLTFALGVAAFLTVIMFGLKGAGSGSLIGVQRLAEASSSSVIDPSVDFTFKAFGYRFVLPEYAPGWVYFWLLMAAGCGLFISEEALNIWVGATLGRMLSLDGTWNSLVESLSRNAPYIISTVLWVYWGVCISDMIPFYLGKLFRQSGASDNVCSKLGVSEEKVLQITSVVQKYGNLIGFIERFSFGVRNPTAFLAGSMGISPELFFAGVCCGGLFTLPIQLGIGFLMRKRPVFALATVATVVGIWTVFPYVVAASTALFLFLRRRHST